MTSHRSITAFAVIVILWLRVMFLLHSIYFFLIEFIGVTLVNKIIQVSGAWFYNTSSVHWLVCSPSQVRSLPITIYPPCVLLYLLSPPSPQQFKLEKSHPFLPPPPPASGNHQSVLCVYELVLFNSFKVYLLYFNIFPFCTVRMVPKGNES